MDTPPSVTPMSGRATQQGPVWRSVDTGWHIVPFHDDGATEVVRILRSSHQDPSAEFRTWAARSP